MERNKNRESKKIVMGFKKWIIKALGGIPRDEVSKETNKLEKEEKGQGKAERMEKQREGNEITKSGRLILENVKSESSQGLGEEIKKSESSVLLGIYEKLAKLEELARIIDERVMLLDTKVSTKDDWREIKGMLLEAKKERDGIDRAITLITNKINELKEKKSEFDSFLSETKKNVEKIEEKGRILTKKINLLESHKRILEALKESGKSPTELASILGYSRQYVWERLQELKSTGYVLSRKEGRRVVYYLKDMSTEV